MKGKKKGKKGLEARVTQFKPLRDAYGRYIPYCDFGWHQGYVKNPEVCKERNCSHYYEIRLRVLGSKYL